MSGTRAATSTRRVDRDTPAPSMGIAVSGRSGRACLAARYHSEPSAACCHRTCSRARRGSMCPPSQRGSARLPAVPGEVWPAGSRAGALRASQRGAYPRAQPAGRASSARIQRGRGRSSPSQRRQMAITVRNRK